MVDDNSGRFELAPASLAAASTALLLMGMSAAAYGPLLIFLMHRFSIGVSVAGLVFGVHSTGSLLGTIAWMVALRRFASRLLVGISLAFFAAGCVGVAIAPSWPLTLTGVFLIGIGFGQLDLAINQLLAYNIDSARVALLNGLNGVYGIGAVAAPLLVSAAADRYGILYAAAAGIALLAWFGFRGLAGSLHSITAIASRGRRRTIALVSLFAVAIGFYVGVEVGVGGWMPTHLHAKGETVPLASTVTSGFWLALAVGRFIIAPIASRVGESRVVLAGSGVAIVSLTGALATPLAPFAYILTGLAIAPIFPTAVAWLAHLNPDNPSATSWMFPAVSIGAAMIPSATGFFIAGAGVGRVPAIYAAVALASLVAFAAAGATVRTSAASSIR